MGADLSKVRFGPLSQECLHLLCREVLAEPGGAFAGQRFGEVFASGERVERSEECGLEICDGLGHGRDPHSTLSERLEPEPQGLHLYLEVRPETMGIATTRARMTLRANTIARFTCPSSYLFRGCASIAT